MEAGRDITASPAAPSAPPRRCSSSWPTARRCRRSFAASLLVIGAACARKPPPSLEGRIDAALARSTAYLVARQEADGSIRSEMYPYFKDGYSLTPLVLAALFAAPEAHPAEYARGVDFLATIVGADGKLRDDLQAPRYPLYSMAIGVLVLNVGKNQRHRAARDALLEALRERQLVERNGWKPEDLSYGGWSYFDGIPTRPAAPDEQYEANLSATLFAVGALALAGTPPDDPALVAARAFVLRCRRASDGGFFFSPAIADGNKAGRDAAGFRSYGSMTADGVRALLRLGGPTADVAPAAAWLDARFEAERNPGDFEPVNEVRRGSSYYYWTWSSAHALRDLAKPTVHGGQVRWAEALAEALLAKQVADGSWKNPMSEMREDDPLVATSFATAALGICRLVLRGEYRSHAATR